MSKVIGALLMFLVGYFVGQGASVEHHRARCTELRGRPVVQLHNNIMTVYCPGGKE